MKKRLLIIFLLLLLSSGIFSCRNEIDDEPIGGDCIYVDDPLKITVTKIEKKTLPDGVKIIIYYEMRFESGKVGDGDVEGGKVKSDEVEVKQDEAEAKKVEVGKEFHAASRRKISGSCSPNPIRPAFKDWK